MMMNEPNDGPREMEKELQGYVERGRYEIPPPAATAPIQIAPTRAYQRPWGDSGGVRASLWAHREVWVQWNQRFFVRRSMALRISWSI